MTKNNIKRHDVKSIDSVDRAKLVCASYCRHCSGVIGAAKRFGKSVAISQDWHAVAIV